VEIVAHEVEHSAHQLLPGMSLGELFPRRMDRRFCWRQAEDEPAVPNIDGTKLQNIGKERTVGFRVRAVEEDVRSEDHEAQYTGMLPVQFDHFLGYF